jgi:hypothetical protein
VDALFRAGVAGSVPVSAQTSNWRTPGGGAKVHRLAGMGHAS